MNKSPEKRRLPQTAAPASSLDLIWIALALLYGASLLMFKPWTLDFPLNDDWAYILSVRRLAQEGHLRIVDFSAVTQILQTLWGALWVKCFGWKLGILKLSTLAAAAIGALSFNSILKSLNIPSLHRLLAVLLFAASPLYYCLSFSFMTEIPYIALSLLACQCYMRAAQEEITASIGLTQGSSPLRRPIATDSLVGPRQVHIIDHAQARYAIWIILGSIMAAGAYLIRQTGLFIPMGYCFYLFSGKKLSLVKMLTLWTPMILTVVGYQLWFHFVHGSTWASANVLWIATFHYLSSSAAIGGILSRSLASTLLLGFFALPLSLGILAHPNSLGKDKYFGAMAPWLPLLATVYLIAVSIFMISQGWMPQLENVLSRSGLGTITVGHAAAKASGFWRWDGFWICASLCSLISAWVVLTTLIGSQATASSAESAALQIFLVPALLQFSIFVTRDRFYDRYVLVLWPAALLAMTLCASRWRFSRNTAFIGTAAMMALSFLGTQDYLAWNKAKWDVANMGVRQGLAPQEVANGFDWDAWWSYERNMAVLKSTKPLSRIGDWDWQAMNHYKAMTSFESNTPGMQVIASAPYRTLLSRQTQYVYLLSRP